jgi:hypothetical protein
MDRVALADGVAVIIQGKLVGDTITEAGIVAPPKGRPVVVERRNRSSSGRYWRHRRRAREAKNRSGQAPTARKDQGEGSPRCPAPPSTEVGMNDDLYEQRRSSSWHGSIIEARTRTARMIRRDQSLKSYPATALADAYRGGRDVAEAETGLLDLQTECHWTIEKMLNRDFWPGLPWGDE